MLTCSQMTDLVTEYLEGKMPLAQRLRFQLHVGLCRHCRRYLSQMRATIRALGLLRPVIIPEPPGELLRRFRAWKGRVP